MKNGASLGRRFTIALVIYTGLLLVLWFGYHNITYGALNRSARENATLAIDNLLIRIGTEFEQMKTAASVIAGSSYVQDFMTSDGVYDFYEKAGTVSEIIQKAAYPISSSDSVITINQNGEFYRFTGGISNESCQTLYRSFHDSGTVYTIIELEDTLYFCYSAPVFSTAGQHPERIGTVVLLTGLSRTRKAISDKTALSGMDTAVILDGEILLSSNTSLEGLETRELERLYGMVSYKQIEGTQLSVAAAASKDAIFPSGTLFIVAAMILLALLLMAISMLYRYLSRYLIRPMASIIHDTKAVGGEGIGRLSQTGKPDFDELVADINDMLDRTEQYNGELMAERQKLFEAQLLKQKMQIGLLASQIDAHFVVNSLESIQTLLTRAKNEDAERMLEGLARLMKYQHSGDALVNIFVEFEMVEEYVSIMNIRHGGRFETEYNVEDRLAAYLMPRLILQPIVENALTHGLQNKDGGARLHIRGYADDEAAVIEVSDNGSGIPPVRLLSLQNALENPEISDFPEPRLHGVALSNIQRRIRLHFGSDYGFQVTSVLGEGTTVRVKLPLIDDK